MIEITNINKTYTSKSKEAVKALSGMNLQFSKNGLVFILGKSGSGKSTFLNILGGLDSANSSKIFINKKKLDRFDETTNSNYRNTYVGFVFQEYNLLEELNVYKNVELALQMQGKTDTRETILRTLALVGLEGLEDRELDELSGGQKQRVAIARALVKDPTIILADEPTGNLDSETSEQVFELFKELSKEKLVIVVSHDAEYAYKFGDRIIEISDGQIIADSDPIAKEDEIYAPDMIRPKLPWEFIFKMSIGNILNNKLRMVITAVITAFLVAILSAVYTMLYVDETVNSDLIRMSSQEHILLTKTVSQGIFLSYNPNQNVQVTTEIAPETLLKIEGIADASNAALYAKANILNGENILSISDLGFAVWNPDVLESKYLIDPSIELVSTIAASPLSFVELEENSVIYDRLIGRTAQNNTEVVISSYLADWILQAGLVNQDIKVQTYQDLVLENVKLVLPSVGSLSIVGIVEYQTPILNNETSALRSVANNLYVSSNFLNNKTFKKDEYGLYIRNVSDINQLIYDVKNAGAVTVWPNYVDQLNRYTRYDLTLIISVIIPVLGYLALVFLGNYISSSILFRKKQIGILRAIGNYISNVEHIFRFEAIFVGFIVMVLVYFMVPVFVDIVNFAFMVHFQDTFISYYHYQIYTVGIGSIVEIFLLLSLLITMLTFTLTHNINLIDPVDVISGR